MNNQIWTDISELNSWRILGLMFSVWCSEAKCWKVLQVSHNTNTVQRNESSQILRCVHMNSTGFLHSVFHKYLWKFGCGKPCDIVTTPKKDISSYLSIMILHVIYVVCSVCFKSQALFHKCTAGSQYIWIVYRNSSTWWHQFLSLVTAFLSMRHIHSFTQKCFRKQLIYDAVVLLHNVHAFRWSGVVTMTTLFLKWHNSLIGKCYFSLTPPMIGTACCQFSYSWQSM